MGFVDVCSLCWDLVWLVFIPVLCVLLQRPWVCIYSCPDGSGRHCYLVVLHHLGLLRLFASLFCNDSWTVEEDGAGCVPLRDSVVLYSLHLCHWCISVLTTICYNLKGLSPYLSSALFKFKNKWGMRRVLFMVPWVCYCVRNMAWWKMLTSWGTCSGFRINNWHYSSLGLCMYWYHCYNFKTDLYVFMTKGMNRAGLSTYAHVWMCVRIYIQARVHECICVCVSTCAVHEFIAHV